MSEALQIMIKRKQLDPESPEAEQLLQQAELLGGLTAEEAVVLSMVTL